jgi:outer membrane protein assembly factor BamB
MALTWQRCHHATTYDTNRSKNMPITRSVLPASVTLVDGVVYAGLGKIYALDAETGTLVREYPVRSAHGNNSIAGGVLYVNVNHGMQGWVQALQVSDGHELWRDAMEGRPSGAPLVVAGRVYTGTAEGDVFAWQASDGRLLWRRAVGSILFSAPTGEDGVLYISRAVNAPEVPCVQALDAETGTVRWHAELPASSTSPLVAGGGVVYASTHQGCLALRAVDGKLLWRRDARWHQPSMPRLLEHTLYVSYGEWRHVPDGQWPPEMSVNVYLEALRAADGERLWRQQLGADTGARSVTAPAVADGVVYVGADNGRLYALDAADGTVQWSCQTGGGLVSAPVVGEDRVYFGVNNGHVFALAAQDGALRWQTYTDVSITGVAGVEIKGGIQITGEGRP